MMVTVLGVSSRRWGNREGVSTSGGSPPSTSSRESSARASAATLAVQPRLAIASRPQREPEKKDAGVSGGRGSWQYRQRWRLTRFHQHNPQ